MSILVFLTSLPHPTLRLRALPATPRAIHIETGVLYLQRPPELTPSLQKLLPASPLASCGTSSRSISVKRLCAYQRCPTYQQIA